MVLLKIETQVVSGLSVRQLKQFNHCPVGGAVRTALPNWCGGNMTVRIAKGSELKRDRTFIRPDGTLTTPEEYFGKRINLGKGRNNPTNPEGEGAQTTNKTS